MSKPPARPIVIGRVQGTGPKIAGFVYPQRCPRRHDMDFGIAQLIELVERPVLPRDACVVTGTAVDKITPMISMFLESGDAVQRHRRRWTVRH